MEHNHNSTKKRILIITTYIKPINMGGGSNAEAFAEFLNKEGHSAKVLSKTNTGLIRINKNIISVRWPNSLFLKIISLLWIFPYSLYLCTKNNYIFFISKHFPLMPLILIFSNAIGKKTIFRSSLIGDDDPFSLKKQFSLYSRICLYAIKKANIFHSINPAITESYIKVYNSTEKVVEVTQGVDTSKFSIKLKSKKEHYCKELGINPKTPIILSVGFLIERKGFKEMFKVLSRINCDFIYLIVGDYNVSRKHPLFFLNEEMSNNYTLGKYLLKNKVRFIGPVHDIEKFYAISDILFMNSYTEGTPNVLLETMASGIVPVIREINGISNYLIKNNETGLVYKDIFDAKSSIETLLCSPKMIKYFSKESASFSKQTFSFNRSWSLINEML